MQASLSLSHTRSQSTAGVQAFTLEHTPSYRHVIRNSVPLGTGRGLWISRDAVDSDKESTHIFQRGLVGEATQAHHTAVLYKPRAGGREGRDGGEGGREGRGGRGGREEGGREGGREGEGGNGSYDLLVAPSGVGEG